MHALKIEKKLVLAISIVVAIVWSAVYAQFTVDDAFIFFRYGKTLSLHHVWNWNPSGTRIEAYTSSLYALLSIFPPLLHVSPALVFKLVGLLSVATMAYLLNGYAKAAASGTLAIALLLCHPYTWIHAYSGLETPVFMLTLLWLSLAIARPDASGLLADSRLIYPLAFLLPLIRPEGAVLTLVVIILYSRARPMTSRDRILIVTLVVVEALYFFVRYKYFHALFPNPFYVKVAHSSLIVFLQNAASSRWLLMALIACIVFTKETKARLMYLTGFVLICLLYLPHTLAMNFSDRFVFQVSFPLILAALCSLPAVEAITAKAAFVFAICLCSVDFDDLHQQMMFYPFLDAAHVELGKQIAPYAAGHSLLGGDMGSLPYYSDWQSYDMWGLCTNEVSHHGVTPEFLKNSRPDLVIFYAFVAEDYAHFDRQETIMQYMQASGNYKRIGAMRWKSFYLIEYLREDTPQFSSIEQALVQANAANAGFSYRFKDILKQKYLLKQLVNR